MKHFFTHPINTQIEARILESNHPAINNKDVRALEISAPPYEDQVAIANALSSFPPPPP